MGRRGCRACFVAAVALAGLLLTPTPGSAKSVQADLVVLDRATAVSKKAKPAAFKPVAVKAALRVGDTAKTDETAFAEIRYGDGSLTRLDASTEFTVTALAGNEPVKATLNQGEVWSEVKQATGGTTRFEVETPNAIAAVRGTAFAVTCGSDGSCVFAVVDGTVDVTAGGQTVSVPEGQQSTVDASGAVSAPVPLTSTVWIQQNQDQDRAEQRNPPVPPTGGPVGGTTEQASGTSPKAIAATLLKEHNAAAATPAPNSIVAPLASVQCEGTKPLKRGDRARCDARTPNGKSYPIRVVVLDRTGKFSATSNQLPVDTAKMEQAIKIGGEVDPTTGEKVGEITSAACEGAPFVIVAIPGGTITCQLADAEGRTVAAVYRFDGAGGAALISSESFH
jgi:hypothetical protein